MPVRRAICLSAAMTIAGAAEFTPLDPATVAHPAAEAAPAASPATYADGEGFAQRRQLIVDGLAGEDLAKWRRGYFTGGDPGKYLPGAAMARLLKDPEDAMARKYLNDDRSWREQYHFAAVNWGRVLPLFGAALTPETRRKLAKGAAGNHAYLSAEGTENHKTMWYTTAAILPDWLDGDAVVGGRSKEQALADRKAWLRGYVRNLYRYGMGEWDSSTYLGFDLNGFLNVYDFAKDPETRLLARAGLDWLVAGYALKYTDGVFCAPHQRGATDTVAGAITDQIGWLWWGAQKPLTAADCANHRYALHAATSGYRPNAVLSALATKRLAKLPAEFANTKPNYWFGHESKPVAGVYAETVRLHRDYTLGALLKGAGGQVMRWQLVVPDAGGPFCLTGGTSLGRGDARGEIQGFKYADGNGLYDRTVTLGPVLVCLSELPSVEQMRALAERQVEADIAAKRTEAGKRDEALAGLMAKRPEFAFVTIPERASAPQAVGDWWTLTLGRVRVGVRPLTAGAEVVEAPTDPTAKKKKGEPLRILRMPGTRTGFVLVVAGPDEAADDAAFAALLGRVAVDASAFASDASVTATTPDGRTLRVRWAEERPEATVDGQPYPWPTAVYDGPFLRCVDGVMTVNDGTTGFSVDMTGDLPVYRPWTP